MPSVLVEQTAEFDERNLFLMLALGLLSLSERLDVLLREHAPEQAAAERGGGDEPEPFAYLLLGAISVRATLRRELRAAALDPADDAARPDATQHAGRTAAGERAHERRPSASLLR